MLNIIASCGLQHDVLHKNKNTSTIRSLENVENNVQLNSEEFEVEKLIYYQ